MIPWPDNEWRAMQDEARLWRAKLHACPRPGTLFLLDGASSSGKSTLVDRLTAEYRKQGKSVGVLAVDPSPDDEGRREYIFVPHETFRERAAAGALRETLALYRAKEDLITIGAYQRGADPRVDEAIQYWPALNAFLNQDVAESTDAAHSRAALARLVGAPNRSPDA